MDSREEAFHHSQRSDLDSTEQSNFGGIQQIDAGSRHASQNLMAEGLSPVEDKGLRTPIPTMP